MTKNTSLTHLPDPGLRGEVESHLDEVKFSPYKRNITGMVR